MNESIETPIENQIETPTETPIETPTETPTDSTDQQDLIDFNDDVQVETDTGMVMDYTLYLDQLIKQQDVIINRLEVGLLLVVTILTLMLYKIFKRRAAE